jgi:putative sterol carrier protein
VADTREFFEKYMVEKLNTNPGLVSQVKAIFQFNITDAGTWTIDLLNPPGSVTEAANESAGCVITVAKADWEKLLDTPTLGMQLFMTGKLKASNIALAMQLQKILA